MTAPLLRPDTREVFRDDLIRQVSFRLAGGGERADGPSGRGDGFTIDGYGAVFNVTTSIASWEGEFDEQIAPGAFRKSIRENTPVMQYDHGRHPLIGSIPLGRWDTVEEDDTGLHVVGRLSDNWLIQPVRDAIAGPDGNGGGIKGMSFRFSVVRDGWVDAAGKAVKDSELLDLLWYGAGDRGPLLRTILEVKCSEVGPVAWPAYDATSVGVRDRSRPFVIDLGQLDLATVAGRSELARAVALADLATPRALPERERQIPPAVQPESTTAQPQTTAPPAVDHAAPTGVAPVDTGRTAGEHSAPISRTNAATLADVRARMRKIESKG
jgi:HK97 family phage prohead protease